jgi:hypothetical protein
MSNGKTLGILSKILIIVERFLTYWSRSKSFAFVLLLMMQKKHITDKVE